MVISKLAQIVINMPRSQITISRKTIEFMIVATIIFTLAFAENGIILNSAYAQNLPRAPVTLPPSPAAGTFQINLKIDGLDYSDHLAQVWVSVNGKTAIKNINPIALLDAQHADADLIVQIPFDVPYGLAKAGDQFTACVKILDRASSAFAGRMSTCQTGIINSTPGIMSESPRQSQTINLTL